MSDKTWECSYERVKPDEVSVCSTCKHYKILGEKCQKGLYQTRTKDGWSVQDCDDYEARECPDCIYYVRNKPKCATGWGVLTPYHTWRAERCGDYTPKVAEAPEADEADEDETLEIIRAKLTPEQYQGYLYGNTIRHARRRNYDKVMLFLYLLWEAHHD